MNAAARQRMQQVQAYLVAHNATISHIEHRPMVTCRINTMAKLEAFVAKGPFGMDCSEAGVLVCHIAGVRDPTGNGYDCLGNTESFLANLRHYEDPKLALAGAFVCFNTDRPLAEQHLAQVHEKDPLGGDPVLFTLGTNADPSFRKLSWLQAGFTGTTVMLSIAGL